MLIWIALTNPKTYIVVTRKSLNVLRDSALKDWMEIMLDLDLYDKSNHNKTHNLYTFSNGSIFKFYSADTVQKLKGKRADIIYLNEPNDIPLEQFVQLNVRLGGDKPNLKSRMIIDFNPSEADHWLYDVVNRNNATLIKSTYKDNEYLPKDQVEELDYLINVDPEYYRIYSLGERPEFNTRIYSHFIECAMPPNDPDDIVYGLDFGFANPTALVKIYIKDNQYYLFQKLYKKNLTATDLVQELLALGIEKDKRIYCDHDLSKITELRRAGFNAHNAIKDVKSGIDFMKSHQIYVHCSSTDLLKEYRKYSWKVVNGVIIDEVVKFADHLLDAARYGCFSHSKLKFDPKYASIY